MQVRAANETLDIAVADIMLSSSSFPGHFLLASLIEHRASGTVLEVLACPAQNTCDATKLPSFSHVCLSGGISSHLWLANTGEDEILSAPVLMDDVAALPSEVWFKLSPSRRQLVKVWSVGRLFECSSPVPCTDSTFGAME